MLRFGLVDSTDAENLTVRVSFQEKDVDADEAPQSFDLPVMVTRSGDYSLPAKGNQVVCLMEPGAEGLGVVLGVVYKRGAAPTDEAGARVVAGDDLRLGGHDASDAVALAPATKTEIQKAIDLVAGVKTAIAGAVVVAQDGGASLKATILAAWPAPVTINEPGAENVVAK